MILARRITGITLLLGVFGCEAEPRLGICESFPAEVDVSTADGSATIAAVEASGVCARSPGPCRYPGTDGGGGGESSGDGGASEGCTRVTVMSARPGACDLTIVSVNGQRVAAHVEFERVVTNRKCMTSVGQVITNLPVIVSHPSSVTVGFTGVDGGAGGG